MNRRTRRQIELVWEEFWRAGCDDPVQNLEQIPYLLFLRRLDRQAPAGMRWRALRRLAEGEQFAMLTRSVFPGLQRICSPSAGLLRDARFTVPTAAALTTILDLLEQLPDAPRPCDTDAFDDVADRLAGIGPPAPASTPRALESLMVALVAPAPNDVICSPLCGSGNFLAGAARYVVQHYPAQLAKPVAGAHFRNARYHDDSNERMLRIACTKMRLYGVSGLQIRCRPPDTPSAQQDEGRYSVILSHLSTVRAASVDAQLAAARTEAVTLQLLQFSRMLKPGGRAAVIVPQATLQSSSIATQRLRQMLLHEQRLDVAMPLALADAGEPKSLLMFTPTDGAAPLAGSWPRALRVALPRSRLRHPTRFSGPDTRQAPQRATQG